MNSKKAAKAVGVEPLVRADSKLKTTKFVSYSVMQIALVFLSIFDKITPDTLVIAILISFIWWAEFINQP